MSDDRFKHPYIKFEDTPLWNAIDEAIDDLVENQDLTETTHRSYIVGYLCKKIHEHEHSLPID